MKAIIEIDYKNCALSLKHLPTQYKTELGSSLEKFKSWIFDCKKKDIVLTFQNPLYLGMECAGFKQYQFPHISFFVYFQCNLRVVPPKVTVVQVTYHLS